MFKREDLARYAALKKVIKQGEFEIHGEAVIAVASLFQWFDELGKVIEANIQQPLKPKELNEPIKKQQKVTKKKTKKAKNGNK